MRIDAFIDLTSAALPDVDLDTTLKVWHEPERLGALGSVTVITRSPVPSSSGQHGDWSFIESTSPVVALNAALDLAGQHGAALLVLTGPVDVSTEVIGALRQQLERDPMFGFSLPRVSCRDRCCIARLTRNGLSAGEWIPRSLLGELPEREILVETSSPCTLIAPQVAGNFGPLDPALGEVAAAMLSCMAAARRSGFRTVACNRAVVSLQALDCTSTAGAPAPSLRPATVDLLGRAIPDLQRSWDEFGGRSAEQFEELYAALPHGRHPSTRPSLLIDVRNLAPLHNGTSHAILGLIRAFRNIDDQWSVSLLASAEGAEFHALADEFGGWPVHTSVPARAFSVCFRPSQPWHIQEMADLHSLALINVYLLLDTISWDVAYCAPPHLDGVWQFLASHADGLIYDSEFTRQRFITRFPPGATVPDAVTHFSFDPADYVDGTQPTGSRSNHHILVVGNHLDHKDVRLTTRTIATAFPYREIRVLGPADLHGPSVAAYPSGALAEPDVHKLYAGAECVVYPSFYEGFGFPILFALAHGRTVLVRRSSLVEELAPSCHGTGRLIMFDRREDLVDLIGRITTGQPVAALALAGPGSGPPRGWRNVATETDRFLISLIRNRAPNRWRMRDRTIAQLVSYRG